MADNAISYRRFSSLPNNISEASGQSLEEIRITRGTPPKNPVAAPMAAPRASRKALALGRAGSDDMRLTEPQEPDQNPFEGPVSVLGLLRSVGKKLEHPIFAELGQVVDGMPQQAEIKGNMQASLASVQNLGREMSERQSMGDFILVRMLGANSK